MTYLSDVIDLIVILFMALLIFSFLRFPLRLFMTSKYADLRGIRCVPNFRCLLQQTHIGVWVRNGGNSPAHLQLFCNLIAYQSKNKYKYTLIRSLIDHLKEVSHNCGQSQSTAVIDSCVILMADAIDCSVCSDINTNK